MDATVVRAKKVLGAGEEVFAEPDFGSTVALVAGRGENDILVCFVDGVVFGSCFLEAGNVNVEFVEFFLEYF